MSFALAVLMAMNVAVIPAGARAVTACGHVAVKPSGGSAVSTTEEETTETEMVSEETVPEATAETEAVEEETVLGIPTDVPMYFQTDYPNNRFASGTIATSGCSITSLAMVATYLTGHTYLPDELAEYFGPYVGSNIERLEYASDELRLPWEKAENWHGALNALKEGKVVIVLMNETSYFTNFQHFIVLAGMTEDGKIIVNDPNASNYTLWNLKSGFENGFSEGYICKGYSGAWIYDKSLMPDEPFIYEEEEYEGEVRYPELNLRQSDIEMLAKLLWVEARGEPIDGQQAIAEVILNRIMAYNFEDTVEKVLNEKGQFSSVQYLYMAEPTQTQYEAIDRAMNGPYILPEDVVFFATFAVNEKVWGKIGSHTFCYQWFHEMEEETAEETVETTAETTEETTEAVVEETT